MQLTFDYFIDQNIKIGYHIGGKGPLVVLLHGFGETSSVWKQQMQHLVSNYTVLVPDLPGSGSSTALSDMSMEGLAQVVASLIRSITDSPHCLIGHSMGGYIALAYAEQYAARLTGLGLFHSTAYADSAAKAATRKKAITFVEANGAHAFLSVAIPGLFAPSTVAERPGLIEKQINESYNFLDSSVVSYFNAMMIRPDRCAVLKRFEKPVLFVSGEADTLIPTQDLLAQASLTKNGYFYELQHSGHMGMLEEPEKTNQILTSYLARLDG